MEPWDGADDLDRVAGPIAGARGLASRRYVDPACHEEDFRRLFAPGWACIGAGKDVPEPGSAHPVELFGRPLVMVRDRGGAVRVFHNVCSHRGMILVAGPTRRLRAIRCPYHHWTYDLSGALKATPHLGGVGVHTHPDFDPSRHGLREVRAALWFDLVFVNLSGTAVEFADFIAPLDRRWTEFRGVALHHGGPDSTARIEVRSNWKLAVENYCEAYHLPAVHPDLNRYSKLKDHYPIEEPGHYSGQGSTVYQPTLSDTRAAFPAAPGLQAKWDRGAEYVALYPNLLLGVHRDHFFAMRLEPVAIDRTVEHLDLYYFDAAAAGDDREGPRRANAAAWRQVFGEDIAVVEGMQRGRRSPGFDGGAFSPAMDGPTHCFHKWAAGGLTAANGTDR